MLKIHLILVSCFGVLSLSPFVVFASDDYPYKNSAIDVIDPWHFYTRECTSYVAWRMNRDTGFTTALPLPPPYQTPDKYYFDDYMLGGHWGDAGNWAQNAVNLGFIVDNTPEVGAIAQWGFGHVAYVERVNANGSVFVSEYNYNYDHNYHERDNATADFYIHLRKFNIQDCVEATVTLNVRPTPGATTTVGQVTAGQVGTVIGGPIGAVYNGTFYKWYNVNWVGLSGWSVESGLKKSTDTTPPTIIQFNVTPISVTVGSSVTITYTTSDTGGSGLKTAQLWRAPDTGYGAPGTWEQVGSTIDISAGGNGPFQGLFSDAPILFPVDKWWYGVHINDGSSPSKWNDEKNSQTNGVPGVFGPKMVTVNAQNPTAPYNIAGFTSTPGNGQINLTWVNPIDLDYAGVQIVRKIGSYPTSPTDGTIIYNSNGTSTIDTGLTNGTTYCHKAFSYNCVPNYSDGVTANATPQQTFQPPTVTGISPTSGPTVGGTTVSITGTNFNGTPTVKFGSVVATIEWYTDGQIVVLCPAQAAGTVHVTVVTVGGTSATSSADQFSYVALDAPITNAMGSGDTTSPGPVLVNNQPTFTWNAVSGATGGYVLIITDLTTNEIYGYNQAAGTTSFEMPADTLPNNHAFKWSMESVAGSFYSSPSQNRYFQTPPPLGTPEIAVEGWVGSTAGNIFNGQGSNGWGTYFGTVLQNSTPPTLTFTVQNTGTAPLTISTITVSSGFTIIEPLNTTIPAGGSDDFTVQMSTSIVGTISGNISINNNSGDNNPFYFTISGTVTYTGTTPTTTVLNVSPSVAVYTQPVTLMALVGAIPPGNGIPNGGTVTFMDGNTPLGWTTLNNGNAVFTTTPLAMGQHLVTAIYSGDGSNFSSSSTMIGSNLILRTVAGNGPHGYSGDGGPATAASLSFPKGVAVDSSGNLFIADTSNSVVRKVDHPTGIITTVAGVYGSPEYNGDNIQATAAGLGPYAVAVDTSGNLFIADSYGWNGRIRKVNLSTGIITTVAGNGNDTPPYFSGDNGPATAASLNNPRCVAVDNSGNLFIADSGNCRIRRVDYSTGIITTVAGGGTGGLGDNGPATAAQLGGPGGVVVDASGNIFIADSGNNRIRKVDHSTGIITTIAGNGTAGYGGDNIQAIQAELNLPQGVAIDNGKLYIGDSSNNRVREVNLSTGIITTIAGGANSFWDYGPAVAAFLSGPSQIALDENGNLFVAEGNGWRIRKISQGNMNVNVISATMAVDLSRDGIPNFYDFSIFASFWKNSFCSPPDWCSGSDFDKNGIVDIHDLQIFAEFWLWPVADVDMDSKVNFTDYAIFANKWFESDCRESNNWCDETDFDKSGSVDMLDLATFARYWLTGF